MADSSGEKKIPIRHVVPEDLPTVPAQIFVAQHDEHEFTLSFFDVRVPIVIGTEERRREILTEVTDVEARCVARVVVAAARLPQVIDVLQQNYETWRKQFGGSDGGDAGDSD